VGSLGLSGLKFASNFGKPEWIVKESNEKDAKYHASKAKCLKSKV
jgi:hypothetical protein